MEMPFLPLHAGLVCELLLWGSLDSQSTEGCSGSNERMVLHMDSQHQPCSQRCIPSLAGRRRRGESPADGPELRAGSSERHKNSGSGAKAEQA